MSHHLRGVSRPRKQIKDLFLDTGSDENPERRVGRASSPQELLSLAAALVRSGVLPREDSARVFAGSGQNRPCSLCNDSIHATDVEYEFAVSTGHSICFHIPCYRAWQQASASLGDGGSDG